MNSKEELNIEKSFDIINEVIGETRTQIEENGVWYMFWGILSTIIPLSTYMLIESDDWSHLSYYPFFGFPFAGLFQFLYLALKKTPKKKQSFLSRIITFVWFFSTINIFIISFLFAHVYTLLLIPTIFIILGMATTISGIAIKNADIWLSGLLINISAVCVIAFNLSYNTQLIYMSTISFFGIFLTGLTVFIKNKKRNV